AINTSKNYLTAQSRRPPRSDVDANDAEYYDGGRAMHDNTSPEAILASQQIKDAIDQAISGLPEELKVAITLREFEAMSYDEIAEVMDCPVGTVRSRIFRARETIDKMIKDLL
ncbi:MAG: sigma-70 family RNA polymerase sigma factor, partial [Thiotrichaceae bacterium]|nr:sigma-70 family RNA polymerase sigma factor [Thiotrichaceae bacterium]